MASEASVASSSSQGPPSDWAPKGRLREEHTLEQLLPERLNMVALAITLCFSQEIPLIHHLHQHLSL